VRAGIVAITALAQRQRPLSLFWRKRNGSGLVAYGIKAISISDE